MSAHEDSENGVALHVVIPAHREHESIAGVLQALGAVRTPIRVTVVCDRADDPTFKVVRAVAPSLPYEVNGVKNAFGVGALNAIKTGLHLSEDKEYSVVVMADGCDEISLLDAMVERATDGFDVVCASRYMKGGRQVGGHPVKRVLARTASLTLHHFVGINTHDVTNSYKVYSPRVLREIEVESIGGFEVGMELTVKAFQRGLRICELPTTWVDRTAGTSRFRIARWVPHYARWYWLGLRSPRSGR